MLDVKIIISHVDMNQSHVDMIMLYFDINQSHVNIIISNVDIIYLACMCKEQKYAIILLTKFLRVIEFTIMICIYITKKIRSVGLSSKTPTMKVRKTVRLDNMTTIHTTTSS